jgi:hypothetical protein
MPLDDKSKESERSVLIRIRDNFQCMNDGSISDSNGNGWMVWNLVDFHRWWLAFETFSGAPLGRKLLNAAADEEEYFLLNNSFFEVGWFRKSSRQRTKLSQRWEVMGWGSFDLTKSVVYSHLMGPLCSGFALAASENISHKRKKVQWSQTTNNQIHLDLVDVQRIFTPAPSSPTLCWDSPSNNETIGSPLHLDLQTVQHGWTHAGERCCLLPSGLFSRFFETMVAQGIQLRPSWLESWDFDGGINSQLQVPLILSAMAVNELVSQSEQPIYIQDLDSWNQLGDAYLKPFGFGKPVQLRSLDAQGGIEFELKPCPQFPLLVGYLYSFWQRGHGRRAKVHVQSKGQNWSVKITSLLSYVE